MKRPPVDHIISEEKAISVACPRCKEKFLVPLPPDNSQLKLEAAAQECEELAAMVQHIHNCRQRDLARARAEAMEELAKTIEHWLLIHKSNAAMYPEMVRALSQSPRPESEVKS
jgi:hypothetical protein